MPRLPSFLSIITILSLSLLTLSSSTRQPHHHQPHRRQALPRYHKPTIPHFFNATLPNAVQTRLTTKRLTRGLLAREFLEAHNRIRALYNEQLFTWDKNLARFARRWGSQRAADCKMIHSYGPYGENLFWGGRDHWMPKEAVEEWAIEKEYYDPKSNQCAANQMCGHYTQIVWRDSVRLGCARIKCQTGGLLIICEYDPPGNYVNENPFAAHVASTINAAESFVNSPPYY